MRWFLALLAACGSTQPAKPAPTTLPAEVTKLVERWEMCWHFAGEEPYDADRAKDIENAEAKWCPGNEAERERLRVKWKDDARVQDALRKLDAMQ
jgi:hypothetical protein